MAPSKFDLSALRAEQASRIAFAAAESPFKLKKNRSRANPDKFRVLVRKLPPRKLAYIRVSNPNHGDGVVRAAKRLIAWADTRQLAQGQWFGYQFERPQVTPRELCHYCVAVEVEPDFTPEGEVGLFDFLPCWWQKSR